MSEIQIVVADEQLWDRMSNGVEEHWLTIHGNGIFSAREPYSPVVVRYLPPDKTSPEDIVGFCGGMMLLLLGEGRELTDAQKQVMEIHNYHLIHVRSE